MISRLIAILLLHQLTLIGLNAVSIGIIRNTSLAIPNTNATIINGSCEQCVCRLLADSTFFAFNCLHVDVTCQLHSVLNQSQPSVLITNTNASFYFRSLPTFVTTDTCINEVTTTSTGEDASPSCYFSRGDFRCFLSRFHNRWKLTRTRRVSVDIRLDFSRHLSDIQRDTCQ